MMKRRMFMALLGSSIIAAGTHAAAQSTSPRKGPGWGASAEKEFRLGPGMGPKLMIEEEWKEHREKMRTLKGAEREAYRREMHERMVARAKERGIEMRPMPGPGGRAGRGPAQ
jgi:hypothetical protein